MTQTDDSTRKQPDRRGFLGGIIAATGAVSLAASIGPEGAVAASVLTDAVQAPAAASPDGMPEPARGYLCFGPDEAAFVEAMVNVMCPADHLTPNGVDCGLAIFIDRQLAGGFGKGDRLYRRGPWRQGKPQLGYQLPLTPEQFFKVGVAAANAACRQRWGKDFSALPGASANRFLQDLAAGEVTDKHVPLTAWFNELVYPLFNQACFADPIYGGNVDKVFWKLIGYPGLPAIHADDMLAYRGKRFPAAADPKSIADFA